MKQVVQDLRSGEVRVAEVPEPGPAPGWVLVAVERSLISSGTERAVVELGGRSLVGKARARPDLVRKTLAVARADGVGAALEKVRSRLDRYTELGYSLAGTVVDAGGDPGLAPGVPVACVGAGYATHGDVVSVPRNLVVPLPPGVSTDDAAFAAPAAIALHALRLAGAEAGAVVAVIGLGLIGQLATRLALAMGCAVVGSDPRRDRVRLACAAGSAEAGEIDAVSRGRGADAVLVCAATAGSEPVALASELARDRGRVVVVGDVGLELDRRVFYEKELSLVVARSYGPGRYDRPYEEGGRDLPAGYVRWTEGRNVEAVLDLLARESLAVGDLVTHRFPVEAAEEAYETLREDGGALAILLEFRASPERRRTVGRRVEAKADALRVGVVGAGVFARSTLVPALAELPGVTLVAAAARSGASAQSLCDRFGIPLATTDFAALLDEVDAVVIATPHAEHAAQAAAALAAGKHVFVEKPLALTWDELAAVAAAAEGSRGLLLVGHNRRFAPLARRAAEALAASRPLLVQIRVAAGPLPAGHWLEDPEQGGRVLGEITHFVDLAVFLAGAVPVEASAVAVPLGAGRESLAATLRLTDGSAATIAYGVGEAGSLAKERIEALGRDGAAVLDDFRRLELHGRRHDVTRGKRDKGHRAQLEAFVAAARGAAEPPVPLEEQLLVAAAGIALIQSARTGRPVPVRLPE